MDDAESIRAIHCALEARINFYDTAANYGCGHSEQILGQAVADRRDKVILATKFGIDLYQFHKDDYDLEKAAEVRDFLEKLVEEGKIRWYGWSTNNPEGARVFAQGQHCTAIQHWMNMGTDMPDLLAICDQYDQASIIRSPLGSGNMTGKFNQDSTFPKDDWRSTWDLQGKWLTQRRQRIEAVRKMFAEAGETRTQAQIALAWIWTRSERTIPIPGFKTVAQVKENIQSMDFGLLSNEQMKNIDQIFERTPVLP